MDTFVSLFVVVTITITTKTTQSNALISPWKNLPYVPTTIKGNTNDAGFVYDPTFIRPDVKQAGITEELCIDTANRMERILVPISKEIHPNQQIGISYCYWPSTATTTSNNQQQQQQQINKLPIVILVHGFDSSCLEFRRLGSQLAARGMNTYAVDLLGWGYTQLDDVTTFSATAKVDALESFIHVIMKQQQHTKQSYVMVGASLGGAACMEIAVRASSSSSSPTNRPQCSGLILIDAQGFVDGIGPIGSLPTPLAKLGIAVLKSIPLRSSANQMSYYNPNVYATDEAVQIGRYHIVQQGDPLWSQALLSFMKSGGFTPTRYVSNITIPTLIVWGRQDNILNGNELTPKFLSSIKNSQLCWIEECGHVPHLEQPMYVHVVFVVICFDLLVVAVVVVIYSMILY
jgi:pimeloyl-ACP methyl ester carboxylesterase